MPRMPSIQYGVRRIQPNGFDPRNVSRNPNDYNVAGPGAQAPGKGVRRSGDMTTRSRGRANSVKQVKSQGMTGTGQGHGRNSGPPTGRMKLTSVSSARSSGRQTKGFKAQVRGRSKGAKGAR